MVIFTKIKIATTLYASIFGTPDSRIVYANNDHFPMVQEEGTKKLRRANAYCNMRKNHIFVNLNWLHNAPQQQVNKVMFHEWGHCIHRLYPSGKGHGKKGTIMDNNLSTADKDWSGLVDQFVREVESASRP